MYKTGAPSCNRARFFFVDSVFVKSSYQLFSRNIFHVKTVTSITYQRGIFNAVKKRLQTLTEYS
jgi:hypothetical protein